MLTKITVFCVLVCVQFAASVLPPFIKNVCRTTDPNWEACCLKVGKETLPLLLKGNKKYNLPVLNPLHLPEVDINSGGNLRIKMYSLDVFGIDTAELTKVKIDVKAKKGRIEATIPAIKLIGKYEIDGRILVLPITGTGPANITAIGGKYAYDFNYETFKSKNTEYGQLLENDKVTLDLKEVHIKLDNLFNGNEQLGSEMNKFLNENWPAILKELGDPIESTIAAIARGIAGAIFKKVPYHELFLS